MTTVKQDTTQNQDGHWWADSCSTIHVSHNINDLVDPQPWRQAIHTSGGIVYSTHKGTAQVFTITLKNVLVVPSFPRKLISLGLITRNRGSVVLGHQNQLIYNGQHLPLTPVGSLFQLESAQQIETALQKDEVYATKMEWHIRYGHLPFAAFFKISEAPMSLQSCTLQCDTCLKTKSTKPPSFKYGIRSSKVGELVHSDLCGPLPTADIRGKRYMLTLVDDYSRYTITRAIEHKSEAADALKEMMLQFESLTGCYIQNLRTDWGGEFKSTEFLYWLRQRGTSLKPTIPHHSETNAVAERTNHSIITMVRTNLYSLPKSLWSLAMDYSSFVKNQLPHKTLGGKSSIELAIPSLNIINERSRFSPFGQPVYYATYKDGMLSDRAVEGRVVGFTPTWGIYKVMLASKHLTLAKNPTPRQLVPTSTIEIIPTTYSQPTKTLPTQVVVDDIPLEQPTTPPQLLSPSKEP